MASGVPPPPTRAVMIDLETLGTTTKAPIVSVAAVVFDRDTGLMDDVPFFYAKVNVLDYDTLGDKFKMDYATLKWWITQPGFAATFSGTESLRDVMQALVSWFGRRVPRGAEVWCQGADFDFPILKNALLAVGLEVPWHFTNQRDTRTLYALVGRKTLVQPPTTHDALQDCKDQVDMVCQVFRRVEFIPETE